MIEMLIRKINNKNNYIDKLYVNYFIINNIYNKNTIKKSLYNNIYNENTIKKR